MATAVLDTNKMNKLGLRRRPTYEEIIGVIDESNKKNTGKLPNRDATFFKSSQEGSFFDGSDAMEQLREEQGRLLLRQMSEVLLRQNARTAGKTTSIADECRTRTKKKHSNEKKRRNSNEPQRRSI